ncbi:MAG TPA: methyltransferase domain-containing protein [Chloroflexota bacterium]|nr:methyltransferase domain-containing protein [Chloroflexota bacterium]HUM67383.1 methyltransferase domain-containing protein [Chloroflexota bacterium]
MSVMIKNKISCPSCHQQLEAVGLRNYCPKCGAGFEYQGGIYDFIPGEDFYWGEVSQEKMWQINKQAMQDGWHTSLRENLQDRAGLISYITNPARLGWLFHGYDPKARGVCVDFGSGWGSLSFGLSNFYDTVYSVDGVYERLRFQAIRAELDGVDNICLIRSSLLRVPLPDSSVDLVVLNGVLEWVGLSMPHLNPRDVQLLFLREVRRILKPSGKIYIGIENRLGVQYFLGAKDHSGLPFTSLVPRKVADKMLQVVNRGKTGLVTDAHVFSGAESEYRTFTYSLRGYRQLLAEAGFPRMKPYWAWQSYSYPRVSGPLDGTGANVRYLVNYLRDLTDNHWLRLVMGLVLFLPSFLLGRLSMIFAPFFLLFADSGTDTTGIEEEILQSDPDVGSFLRTTLGDSLEYKTTYLLLNRKGKVRKAVRVVADADNSPGMTLVAERETEGIAGRMLRPYRMKEIETAATWLACYQQRTASQEWSPTDLEQEMDALVAVVRPLLTVDCYSELLNRYHQLYIDSMSTARLRVVGEHGDFTPPNILVSTYGEIEAVDWEFSRGQGNPLLDVGAMGLSLLRRSARIEDFSIEPNSQTPLLQFFAAYLNNMPVYVPVHLSPAYYLLRLIARKANVGNGVLENHLALATWLPLLKPVLEYSINSAESSMSGSGNRGVRECV